MTGEDIVAELLRAREPIVELVPLAQIQIGRLPTADLPALLITTTSSDDRSALKRGGTIHTVDRVSVTVKARSHRQRKQIIGLVGAIAADFIPTIAGLTRASVQLAGRGPDLDGPGDRFERTQDFRVSFDRPAS